MQCQLSRLFHLHHATATRFTDSEELSPYPAIHPIFQSSDVYSLIYWIMNGASRKDAAKVLKIRAASIPSFVPFKLAG